MICISHSIEPFIVAICRGLAWMIEKVTQKLHKHQDVRGESRKGEVAVTAEPSLHRRGTADKWSVKCLECLRWLESTAQHNGEDIQTWLPHIRCSCEYYAWFSCDTKMDYLFSINGISQFIIHKRGIQIRSSKIGRTRLLGFHSRTELASTILGYLSNDSWLWRVSCEST